MSKMFLNLQILFVSFTFAANGQVDFISGVDPSHRPEVNKITVSPKLKVENALSGVEGEIPNSLRRAIDSQGGWYTPLTVAGMSGPYDLRSFHSAEDIKKAERYDKSVWDPIHFKPLIDTATDKKCLSCHQSILSQKVKDSSQAGVSASTVKAWYQNLDTYSGQQETFHWRHMESPLAKRLTQFKCTTCHQGNDPREKALVPESVDGGMPAFTLRKTVNPQMCLMCHGKFPDYKNMNLPGPWSQHRDIFQNNCLTCHAAFRTNRHKVNFLKTEAIEEAGRESGDSCYGCHGGRAWYRVSFPYPRHKWPGMPDEIPSWAKDRLTESESRFLQGVINTETGK